MSETTGNAVKSREGYQTAIVERRWLTEQIFEIDFHRPRGLSYLPGQKIRLANLEEGREYTPINAPNAVSLTFCIRLIPGGRFTPQLAAAEVGTEFWLSAATGFFTYQTHENSAVFLATGTGIAPFLAFVRAGVQGFWMFHGVRAEQELIYRKEMSSSAHIYIPCVSEAHGAEGCRRGHITDFLEEELEVKNYDFYLCGNAAMIRDAFRSIDHNFPGSRVFVEPFY